ncbi:MAG TPA: hypothetical protein P5165_11300 [Spirochaetia bacterium]|nr:hypothetical protein [Spirochaetales bacterium]HRY73799.1 hypothetical protein [Spirochaetia bacterium]
MRPLKLARAAPASVASAAPAALAAARAAARASAAALAAVILLGGCAARIRYETPVDPLAVLAGDAFLYARIRGPSLALLAPALLPEEEARAIAPLIARSRELGLALTPPGEPGERPGLEGLLVGDYPFRSASFALSGDGAWKREGPGYANAAAGVRVALPGPTVVLAASGPIEPLVARLKAPGPEPIPARLAPLAGREVVLYAPLPFDRLAESLLGERLDIPARGLILAAERAGAVPGAPEGAGSEAAYDLALAFLMEDEDSARIYKGAARLAWYALVRSLFPEEAEAILSRRIEAEGDLVAAAGIRVRASSLAGALSRLGGR